MSILQQFADLRRDIARLEGILNIRGTASALAPFTYWSPQHRPTSIQVRRKRIVGGVKIWERSRRFSVGHHGSLRAAQHAAEDFRKKRGWKPRRKVSA